LGQRAVSAGNQLPTLQDEYKEYRIAKKLWNEANSVVSYTINSQGRLFRTSDGKEVADLANIMGQNYDLFEVHIVSLEWAKHLLSNLA
jgi:hypothetical protein